MTGTPKYEGLEGWFEGDLDVFLMSIPPEVKNSEFSPEKLDPSQEVYVVFISHHFSGATVCLNLGGVWQISKFPCLFLLTTS